MEDRWKQLKQLLTALLVTGSVAWGASANMSADAEIGYCPSLPYPVVCTVLVDSTPPRPQPTPTGLPTSTRTAPTPTQIVLPTATALATADATANPALPNLLVNGGLNHSVAMPFQERTTRKILAWGWNYFECWPGCPALRQGTGNPFGLEMGSAEFKPASNGGTPGREWVEGNSGQTWFVPWQTYQAGIYQTVTVPSGALCTASARVRSWSTPQSSLVSQLDTADDRANSTWRIWIHPYGGTDWRDGQVWTSRDFGYADNVYDTYASIAFSFRVPADSDRITVFFGDTRLWPFGNNQSYVDAAALRCN
jgi:hypothetical protein